MRYGIMGSLAPLMMKKNTLEYLGRSGFEVSRAQIMREYRGIIDRQPEMWLPHLIFITLLKKNIP